MKRYFICFVLIIWLFLQVAEEVSAELLLPANIYPEKRVVLVTLDRLFLEDLLNCSGPLLSSLLEQSGVSLMNANTAGRPGTDGGYLTLGAGARLQGHWSAGLAFERDEIFEGSRGEGLYLLHGGGETVPRGELLHPYWLKLAEVNKELPYPAQLGALGEVLRLHGLKAAVVGNSDSDEPGRQAVTVAMDSLGLVRYGEMGPFLVRHDEKAPFGFRSDYGSYLAALERVWPHSSLIVIDWGDSSRIDQYREHLPAGRRAELLAASLAEFDLFLHGLLSYLDEQTMLIILSPSPPLAVSGEGQRMTPLILYHQVHSEGGVLSSGTTRRPGIVTNIDVLPTALKHLGISAPFFFWGAPLEFVPASAHLESLTDLSARTARIYNQRPPIIRGYILTLIIACVTGILAVVLRLKYLYPLRYLLVFLLTFPLVLLAAPVFTFFPAADANRSMLILLIIALPLVVPPLFLLRRNHFMAVFAYCGLTVSALLLWDLWQGAPLNSRSLLGYDPVSGARFYGMGNEYMGVLIGSFILGFISLLSLLTLSCQSMQKSRSAPLIVGWGVFTALSLLIIYSMASPAYGANFGGSVTAGMAMAVTLGSLFLLPGEKRGLWGRLCLLRVKMGYNNYRVPTTVLLLVFMSVTALFIYYLNNPGDSDHVSHLGRTMELVRAEGARELGDVVLRKLEMNIKLVRFSPWSRVFLGFVALLTVFYYYPAGLMGSLFRREPFFKTILGGIIAGSFAAFCFNDSGVVAAATVMLYGGLPLLMLSLREVFS